MKDDIIELARAAGVHPLAMSEEYLPGLERLVAAAVAAEREACAKVCENKPGIHAWDCAAAIRARSMK